MIAVGKERDDLESFCCCASGLMVELLTESRHAPAAPDYDYLVGMAEAPFLSRTAAIACEVPERTCLPN